MGGTCATGTKVKSWRGEKVDCERSTVSPLRKWNQSETRVKQGVTGSNRVKQGQTGWKRWKRLKRWKRWKGWKGWRGWKEYKGEKVKRWQGRLRTRRVFAVTKMKLGWNHGEIMRSGWNRVKQGKQGEKGEKGEQGEKGEKGEKVKNVKRRPVPWHELK